MITIEVMKWLSPLRSARFAEMSLSELQKQDSAQENAGLGTIGKNKEIALNVVLDSVTYDAHTGLFIRNKTG